MFWTQVTTPLKLAPKGDNIANNSYYGKKWESEGKQGKELENLIASEVHARLVGEHGSKVVSNVKDTNF